MLAGLDVENSAAAAIKSKEEGGGTLRRVLIHKNRCARPFLPDDTNLVLGDDDGG